MGNVLRVKFKQSYLTNENIKYLLNNYELELKMNNFKAKINKEILSLCPNLSNPKFKPHFILQQNYFEIIKKILHQLFETYKNEVLETLKDEDVRKDFKNSSIRSIQRSGLTFSLSSLHFSFLVLSS